MGDAADSGVFASASGTLCRRNAERLAEWDPQRTLPQQSQEFQAAHKRLQAALEALFAHAQREVQALTAAARKEPESSAPDPRLGPLQSMLNHREGLAVLLARPYVPLDNNAAERALRRPVIGRLPFIRRLRDARGYAARRNSSSRRTVSSGRSCCTQWPAPSSRCAPRKSVQALSCIRSNAPGR